MHKTYDIDIEMTATIGQNTVNHIVMAAVEQQTGRQISDIRVKYDGDKFAGYHITFNNKKAPTKFKPSKEFIVNNFDEN